MSPVRALILDFDGVIVESNDLKTRAFESLFGRFPEHADAMMAYHHAHVSESRFAKLRHLVVDRLRLPEDDPLLQQLARDFSTDMLARMTTCPMVPGAQEFLHSVHGRVPLFLASVTPQEELELILQRRGLSAFFTGVYGCPPWKNDALGEIVSRLGSALGILFIGDSAGDQRAALQNGVEFVARDSGLPFDTPPPRSFSDLAQIAGALDGRLPIRWTGHS